MHVIHDDDDDDDDNDDDIVKALISHVKIVALYVKSIASYV